MKIYYYNGTLWKDVTALDSSFCEETIDRFSRISLDFVLPSEELVPELCHVTWRGEEYTLYTVPKVVKVSTREYRYTLILEGRYKELERTLVKDKLGRTKFVFTGRAGQYADLISGCIDGWSTGTCTTGDRTQVVAFSNNTLLEACRMVASKFETEVRLDGGKIAFGRVEKYKGDPLRLAYRQGLQKEITTEPDSKEIALGRLYVMGGEHNIDPAKYGSRTLHLPKGESLSVEGHTFRVDAAGRYISLEGDTRLNTSERALDATTIYPKRVGTISKVEQKGDEWDVIDETNPIDYTQYRVGGDVMRLEFQSGRLAGRSFDLTTKDDKLIGYVHAEKRFRLVRREIDGVLMPEPATFFPAVGDKYAIFGCSLPDEYIKSAEAEMLSTAAKYMAERLETRMQYRAELDGLWAKKNWSTVAHKFTIGTIVRLEGAANDVRISSVRTSLNSPYTPRITFSNAPYMVGSLTTQIATIESAEVRTREETRQSLLSLQARTYEDTKVVREMIERLRVEGFTQAIKPETLQSMYAVIGSPALQFDFVRGGRSVPFSWSEGKGGTITIPGQSIQRKASGTTLEPGDKTTVTDIPALTYTLKAEEQQAYVYTELSPAPHFVISTKPLAISPDRLLVGLLNGEEGKRAFTPLYGFTEITPGQLKTDLIRSQDGKSYWDLLSGKFATTGDLLIGDPNGNTCLAYIDGVLYVKGLTVNVGSSSTTIEDALLEQERKIENAKKVRQPIIKNGTWWVWDDTTNQLIDSGKPAQGAKGEKGTKGEKGAPGLQGLQGKQGEQGLPGKSGRDGLTAYTHIAYADTATGGGFSQSPAGKSYVGMYVDHTATDSTSPSAYAWSLIKGADGRDGTPGKHGKDGRTPYLHIAYADTAQGGGFSQSPDGKPYIGQYTDYTQSDSSDPSRYTWSRIKGESLFTAWTNFRGVRYKGGRPSAYNIDLTQDGDIYIARAKDGGNGEIVTSFVGTKGQVGWLVVSISNVGETDVPLFFNGLYNSSVGGITHIAPGQCFRGVWQMSCRSDYDFVQLSVLVRNHNEVKVAIEECVLYKEYPLKEFSTESPVGRAYIGTYIGEMSPEDPLEYKWAKYVGDKGEQGEKGDQGLQGKQGEQGEQGLPGKDGKDGTSQYTKRWIDARDLDPDKYYPVTIYSSSRKRQFISLMNTLEGSVPPWSRHTAGFSVSLQWSVIGSGWGSASTSRSITNATYGFTKDGVVPVGDIGQITMSGEEYIYVRGGGAYFFTTNYADGEPGSIPVLRPEGYTWKSESYSAKLPIKTSVIFPLTDSEVERAERKREVAAVRKGLANTDTLVSALEKAQSKLDQGVLTKADTKDIQYLLDSLKNGDTKVAGGLLLSSDVILSDPNSRDVTATISGTQTQGANVMRLGISYTCDEDKKATVERAGAKWGINLSSILTGLESDSDRIRKLDELGFTIVGGQSLAWPKWEICKAADAKEGGEATALANDGTGHIGELYFWGESIGFGATDKRYMQIGGTARSEYDMVNASTVIRKFGISGGTVRKSGTFVLDRFDSRYSNREIKYTANLSAWAEARAYRVPDNGGWDPNDHRYYKPEYEEFVRTESSATVQLRLELRRGGSTIKTVTSPQVSVSVSAQGGQFGINEQIPQSALYAEDRKSQDVTITISPSDVREQDTVTLSLVTTIRRYCYHHQGSEEIDRYASATASAGSIVNFLPYDTSKPMVSVTKDRAAFFYGRSKYVLLNYLESYVMKVVGNMIIQGNLTLKGGLTAEYADFPGVPMIGGMVSEKCIFKKSFGRYKNQRGRNFPQVSYDYSSKVYTVYHSIGNDKYIPVLTPMEHRWGDTLSISNVSSYSFQVQLTNGNQDRNQCAFTYVCFKAD